MKQRSPLTFSILLLLLGGCTNLKVVRDYAKESAQFSAYSELTERYRDTYQREQPYLDLEDDKGEQITDQKRQAAYEGLIRIHKALTAYMQTLAKLAGEDSFSLSKDVTALSGSIKALPELGIDAAQVDAYSGLVQVITRWATAAAQERAVRQLVEAADPQVQQLLAGMQHLLELYRKTNQNERAKVVGVFEVYLPFTGEAKDVLLNRLARAQLHAKLEEYRQADLKYVKAGKAIQAMADGHRKLKANLAELSREDLKQSLIQAATDIKTLREGLTKS